MEERATHPWSDSYSEIQDLPSSLGFVSLSERGWLLLWSSFLTDHNQLHSAPDMEREFRSSASAP
ncbi:MAG: hypothetical protein DMG06_23990 [Acidobacteria bacterium]|nr:MAG: hypothetical protein DMG06_23990 [Acidobacteriota bacterium]